MTNDESDPHELQKRMHARGLGLNDDGLDAKRYRWLKACLLRAESVQSDIDGAIDASISENQWFAAIALLDGHIASLKAGRKKEDE